MQPDWLDHLERRVPGLAVPGLIRIVTLGMLFAFGLITSNTTPPEFWFLSGDAVLHGEVWRIFTFLFYPPSTNMILLVFELMILVMCGDGLEEAWGSFRVSVYYLTGAFALVVSAFLLPGLPVPNTFLNLSLFLAFATVFPDFEILLFFILPLKVKYLAMFSGILILWTIITAPLVFKISAALSIANYLLFFGPTTLKTIIQTGTANRRRRQFEAAAAPTDKPRNVCVICGNSSQTQPDIQIRYCTCPDCGNDGRGFCEVHLIEHEKGNRIIH